MFDSAKDRNSFVIDKQEETIFLSNKDYLCQMERQPKIVYVLQATYTAYYQ